MNCSRCSTEASVVYDGQGWCGSCAEVYVGDSPVLALWMAEADLADQVDGQIDELILSTGKEGVNIYEKALRVLDEHGWTQHAYQAKDGRVCLAGALNVVITGNARISNSDSVKAVDSLRMDAVDWNDDPHTTFEDVKLLLKRAAAGER